VDNEEPLVEELIRPGDKPTVTAYIQKYVRLAKQHLPQLAKGTAQAEEGIACSITTRRPSEWSAVAGAGVGDGC
jgi:hypothetical protein